MNLLENKLIEKGEGGGVGDREERRAEDALRLASGLRFPARREVLLFLSLYLFIAVIVNYIVFKRLKRLEYGWPVMVIVSFLFFITATRYGIVSRGHDLEAYEFCFLKTERSSPFARRICYDGIVSKSGARLDVSFDRSELFLSEVRSKVRSPARVRFNVQEDERTYLAGLQIPPAGMRVLRTESIEFIEKGFEADLQSNKGIITGEVVNNSVIKDLGSPFLFYGGVIFQMEKSGNKYKVGGYRSELGREMALYHTMGRGYDAMFKPDAERIEIAKGVMGGELFYIRRSAISDYIHNLVSASSAGSISPVRLRYRFYTKEHLENFWLHRAYFCAWIRGNDVTVRVGREFAKKESWRLLLVEVPVKIDPRDRGYLETYLYRNQSFTLEIGKGSWSRTIYSFPPGRGRGIHVAGPLPLRFTVEGDSSTAYQDLSVIFDKGLNVSHLGWVRGSTTGQGFGEGHLEIRAFNRASSRWDAMQFSILPTPPDEEEFGFFEIYRCADYYDASTKAIALKLILKNAGESREPVRIDELGFLYFMDATSDFEDVRSYFE